MDVETVFRATFGIKKEQDILGLIEAAVNVAALIVPHKLKKRRSRIVKLLFDEDPLNSTDLFSDDELVFDDEDDKLIDRPKIAVSSLPPPPKNEGIKKGFKKAVKLMSSSQGSTAAPPTPSMLEKMVGRQDNSMELKILGHKYHEEDEAEKKGKGKRKIECMDFRESPKKRYCGGRNKAKPPAGGDVRRRLLLSRMKAQYGN
nr:hypothetical protein DM860_006244 [Ipomoea batatas]GMC64248.1 hypothetical protein DM860_006244 [Ipomoea batatas]